MFRFVIRKMFSQKWMVLALLIGNVLLVSIAAGTRMYTHAVFQRSLTKQLENYLNEFNTYPGLTTLRLESAMQDEARYQTYLESAEGMEKAFGVPALYRIAYCVTSAMPAELQEQRDDAKELRLSVGTLSDLPEHITLVAGSLYRDEADGEGIIDAVISENAMIRSNVLLGDIVTIPKLTDADGNPIRVRIAGVFREASASDPYWVRTPTYYSQVCLIPENLFREKMMDRYGKGAPSVSVTWYTLLEYTQMRGDDAENMYRAAESYREQFNGRSTRQYTDAFSDVLAEYLKESKKTGITLTVLEVPVLTLLAAFVFMVSRQMISIEQNEIAIVKSRGSSRKQILGIYLWQSMILAGLALVLGIPAGVFLCSVIGSANSFLEFVQRSALPVEVTGEALLFSAAAAALSVCAMVLPALRASRLSIVAHKQRKKGKRSAMPLWQKSGIDVILIGVALYGLYTFHAQKDFLSARIMEGASIDPLLFSCSSLFMIGCGLFAVRIMPGIVFCVYRLFRRFLSPALYASFLHVLRARFEQTFIMVFLIMTVATGVFNAQAARTINQSMEDNLRYTLGADIVLAERWENNASALEEEGGSSNEPVVYFEPDWGRFSQLDGAQSVTKVYVDRKIQANVGSGTVKDIQLMAIHTREFGQTAWFKDSLSDIHWYHYLNAMARNSRAILVSRNFQTDHNCKIGDSITFKNANGDGLRGIIYGFVDYFPGFAPTVYRAGSDGLYSEKKNYLIVANLQQVQYSWGVLPYQVWMRNTDKSAYMYDFLSESRVQVQSFSDVSAMLTDAKNDPMLQGTNGMMTVGFLVVLALCAVGFLIYWILSIRARTLMFGIFRAMGMSMREIITMLVNEQVWISAAAAGTGVVVGNLTGRLYMPLVQLAYASSDHVLPLEVVRLASDQVRIGLVIGAIMLLCLLVLGVLISKMKITQALKLGED